VLRNAGAWLAECHRLPLLAHTRPRQESRDKFLESIDAWAGYLAGTVGRAAWFRDLGDRVHAAANRWLPASLPLGMSHSDFAPNNVFVGPTARVTVFDTIGRWQAPIYEDLGHFLFGLKAPAPRIGRAAACADPAVCPYERPFLEGYFERRPVPWAAVRLFELQALLDRWAGLADAAARSTGLRRFAKRVRLAWWSARLARYATAVMQDIDARHGTTPRLLEPSPAQAGRS
jgi:hypothetical protein